MRKIFITLLLLFFSINTFAFSVGIENAMAYVFHLTNVSAGGNPSGYCSEQGKGVACMSDYSKQGQQWVNIDNSTGKDGSWIHFEYDIATYDTLNNTYSVIGHFGLTIDPVHSEITNQSSGKASLQGQFQPGKVQSIEFVPDNGPFPNAPLASPAVYKDGTPIKLVVDDDKIKNDKGVEILLRGVVRPSL